MANSTACRSCTGRVGRRRAKRWLKEGLPPDANEHEFFNAVPMWAGVHLIEGLFPAFEEETIEETSEYRIFRATDGVVQQAWKHKSCIPRFTDFTLKEAKDWPEYKKRLQPVPERIPADLDQQIARAESSGLPIFVGTYSLMGWIRNWMGVENMSYLFADDRDCYANMVMTLADLTCWALDRILPRMHTTPEAGFGWEDICGRSGPLVSPEVFRQCVAPGYRRVRASLSSTASNCSASIRTA